MSKWVYLGLYFKNLDSTIQRMAAGSRKPSPGGLYKKLMLYLNEVVDALSPGLVGRYFFLFEPHPHLFMALEVKDRRKVQQVAAVVGAIAHPGFIERAAIDPSIDVCDPPWAVDFFCAGTRFALARAARGYRSAYQNNDTAKLVHCFCNQVFVTRHNELAFYAKRLSDHGIPVDMSVRVRSAVRGSDLPCTGKRYAVLDTPALRKRQKEKYRNA